MTDTEENERELDESLAHFEVTWGEDHHHQTEESIVVCLPPKILFTPLEGSGNGLFEEGEKEKEIPSFSKKAIKTSKAINSNFVQNK